jgi:pimeloyl-ACP methyl ester carboxylesterase
MRNEPMWEALEAYAHTLAYDGAIIADTLSGHPLPRGKWVSVTMPTLVMDGGASPAFMHHGAQALTDILPNGQRRRFPDQDHGVADDVFAPVLVEFFKG